MPIFDFAFPRVVYKQTTQPDAIAGGLWYNTSSDELFYSDGTNWIELSISLGALQTPILENSLDILDLQIAETLESGTSASIVKDIFTDSGGELNTINTGNTTATFSTDTYLNSALDQTDNGGSSEGTEAATVKRGIKIETNEACNLWKVVKSANINPTHCYLQDASKVTLATAAFSGNDALFNYDLEDETIYYIAYDKEGASYTHGYNNTISLPYTGTNADIIANYADGTGSLDLIEEVHTRVISDVLIETEMQSLSSTPANFQVFAWRPTLEGSGVITADISFDNGANFQEGIALNTATEISDVGDEMILRLNLESGAVEVKGYGILIW